MNDLNQALGHIRDIRRQVAQVTEFRGYGPLTLFVTAALAALAGLLQLHWIADPQNHPLQYTLLWTTTAILSASVIAIQTLARSHRIHSGMANEMIYGAMEQFLPAVITGALLTLVMLRSIPASAWMLPALWQIVYGLGIFSSCRFLPRTVMAAGAWYVLAGLSCMAFADARAMSPWIMAGDYAMGQSLLAGILYFSAREEHNEA